MAATKDNRVAQYLRMSTEHQRYSLENQAAANAAYAAACGLEIVRTYSDSGRSGLTLRGRDGLKLLLADALGGSPGYGRVLVYDVSRWGRFQDPDQSAHYEFLCRQAGVDIEYTAEQFSNDGSLFGTLAKTLKRVMAAEFSRDLSAKVAEGQKRSAAKGFWQGGPARFGFRRQLVEEDGAALAILRHGEQKSLTTQRVVLVLGPEAELETVRTIFRLYAAGMLPRQIADQLRERDAPRWLGQVWSTSMVRRMLSDEQYAGVQVTSKTRMVAVGERRATARGDWIRVAGAFSPIVDRPLFDAVQAKRQGRHSMRDTAAKRQALLGALATLLRQHGRLTHAIISHSQATASPSTYQNAFGSLTAAYKLIGYAHRSRPRLLDGFGGDIDAMLAENRRRRPMQRMTHRQMLERLHALGFRGGIRTLLKHLQSIGAAHGQAGHYRLGGMTDDELLAALSDAYVRHGHLSMAIISQDPDLPAPRTIATTFGSLSAVYDRLEIGDGRGKPILGPHMAHLRQMVEANAIAPADQRLRYVDMWTALRNEGYAGGYTGVRKNALKVAAHLAGE